MSKKTEFDNFTENQEEVERRIQHLIDYHGLEFRECSLCGDENPACPKCKGEMSAYIFNTKKCDCPDCPVNSITPAAALDNYN